MTYQPDKRHFVYVDFTPQAGTEQAGRRPGLVLSPKKFNIATGLAFVCPVTTRVKGGGFEVPIKMNSDGVTGAVLCDHLRSVDWLMRNMEFKGNCPEEIYLQVIARIEAIILPE